MSDLADTPTLQPVTLAVVAGGRASRMGTPKDAPTDWPASFWTNLNHPGDLDAWRKETGGIRSVPPRHGRSSC